MDSINFIFEHGKGCSGKDTQAHLIREHLGENAIELSTGDIFRSATKGFGDYARFKSIFDPYIEEVNIRGGLISDKPIVEVVKIIVAEQIEKGITNFIFTGFPRTVVQLDLVDEMLKELNAENTHIFFDVSDVEIRERAARRFENAIAKGEDPRPEDKPNVVEDRLKTYRENTYPMIIKLDQENRLIKINGEGTVPEVGEEVSRSLFKER